MAEDPGHQLDLLNDGPIARRDDPASSIFAASRITEDGTRAIQQEQVLRYVEACPGRTSRELAVKFNADRYMVARRLSELRGGGYVKENRQDYGAKGMSRTCTVSNREALLWEPTGKLRQQLDESEK